MIKEIIIPYFPKGFKYSTPFLFLTGFILIITGYIIWPVILFIFSALILTTNYVTKIDVQSKVYLDYLSVMGLRLNVEKINFNYIERIVVVRRNYGPRNYSQYTNVRSYGGKSFSSDYTAKIVFDNRKSVDFITRTDKSELMQGLYEFAKFLGVEVEDRS